MIGVPRCTGRQKLYQALLVLASERGPIEERLAEAFRLAVAPIDLQLDLPEEVQPEFHGLRTRLQNFVMLPSAVVEPGAHSEAAAIARQLVAFYDKLVRLKP